MGKHNGKARNSGMKVGSTLLGKAANSRKDEWAAYRHTTTQEKTDNMQSIIEQNDLSELLHMADLAGREFTGERNETLVISTGAVQALDAERSAAARVEAQQRNMHKLVIPRRPAWSHDMTAEQIKQQEQTYFLNWRRTLARMEEEERLVLTPFEKNLEVWRQLWRVLERSDILVQVVDARDPTFYRSEDLESYARSLHASKKCVLLLNKADLLPEALRAKWADYFDSQGVQYLFWSAAAAIEQLKADKAADKLGLQATVAPQLADNRVKVLSSDELMETFSKLSRAALEAAGPDDPRNAPDSTHVATVGLIGYPNVGKSSTINALFGSKKTAVAPTPGKTKHFQTLYISPELLLCDCPGLVLPRFANSKAEMVTAGVVPIDRLTDMQPPLTVLAERVSRQQLYAQLRVACPRPRQHEDAARPPTATELMKACALNRGWLNGSGLPDETRTGRQLLKDYTAGRLLYCTWPPGEVRLCSMDDGLGTFTRDKALLVYSNDGSTVVSAPGSRPQPIKPTQMDMVEMAAMNIEASADDKPKRAPHKFNKKPTRDKQRNMRRVKAGEMPYGHFDLDDAREDYVPQGKRGGLVRTQH